MTKLAQKEITLGHCEVIEMPERTIVHEHKGTGFKYTVFAFPFPDGHAANLILSKDMTTKWQPSKDIKKIIIEFNED